MPAGSVVLSNMDCLCSSSWVTAQVARSMEDWHRSAGSWSPSAPRFTPHAQRKREKAYDRGLNAVERHARYATPSDSAYIQQKLVTSFARFAAEALDLGRDSIDVLTGGFLPVGMQLGRWARRFDVSLSNDDIVQACRNAWTACGLQPVLGARLGLTPAILGYSLIYPYSDNFLDQRSITHSEKQRFTERFGRRLNGEPLAPDNAHEASLWQLVSLIEQQFPRPLYPTVFAALLAIHRAQGESVRQIDSAGSFGEEELLRISCDKGGTSVLADAFLVHGKLTPQQAEFAFAWGVLLQLGDDLQDIAEDLQRGSDTLFTRAIHAGLLLDDLVSQLLSFSDAVGAQLDELPQSDAFFKHLLRMSWRSLILMAVAQCPAFFTEGFATSLETYSPFRFAFLRERRERLTGETGLFDRLFQIILAERAADGPVALSPGEAGIVLPPPAFAHPVSLEI